MKTLFIAFSCWCAYCGPCVAADVVELAKSSGVQGGLIVHLGCGDGRETMKLRLDERYLVHGLDTREASVQAARQNILAANQYGPVSVDRFDGQRLPYVDNLVNLIVSEGSTTVPREELLRALAPLGVALVNGDKIVKPWPADIDEWTHYLHGPDNNAVAEDQRVNLPRSMQWIAEPRWGRSHEELASMSAAVTAQGRIFYVFDEAPLASIRFTGQWKLIARDAFNGTLFWKKDIPTWNDHLRHFRSGPVHLPRRLVAAQDRVYATLGFGSPVAEIDAANGRTLRVYEGTEFTEEILFDNGVLFLAVGNSETDRLGGGLFQRKEPKPADFRFVAAIEAATGRLRWKKTFNKDEFLLPQTLAVGGASVFYQDSAGLVRLDALSGTELWRAARKTPSRRMAFSSPTLVVASDVVLLADEEVPANEATTALTSGPVKWGVHGWNEPGFNRSGKCALKAYDVESGKELWSAPCSKGYNSPVDIFVVKNTVWVGADYTGYDLKTGRSYGKLNWKGAPVGMAHHRCYRNKATENFILTGRSGVEVVSLEEGWLGNNSWLRGTCQYGILPANGLLYAPPNACACFGKVKTPGFFAAAAQRGKDGHLPFSDEAPLQKGDAYGQPAVPAALHDAAGDWPMYRHDAARSGVAGTTLPADLKRRWLVPVGGRLTQPVIVGGAVYVASTDTHTVHALDMNDGRRLWSYTSGGRVDSAPTLYAGKVFFGSADGWVYCLRATDGALSWRFRAAPSLQLASAYGQLESLWPVHGSVLVQNGILYASAGRSSYLDGGIVIYAIDPATGRQLSRSVVSHLDPDTGRQLGKEGKAVGAFDMEGVYTDILSGDGDSIFLKHLRFTRTCEPVAETKPHLFAVTGFLGEEWFVRSFWLISDHVGAGWGGWTKPTGSVPFGRILCVDGDQVYGYGRVEISSGATGHKADAYHLYAMNRSAPSPTPAAAPAKPRKNKAKKAVENPEASIAPGWSPAKWSDRNSLIVRAMVLAGDQLAIAGPPDLGRKSADILAFDNEDETLAASEGRKGVYLRIVSAADGTQRLQTNLSAMPVFDGMAAAHGRLLIAMKDGTVECW